MRGDPIQDIIPIVKSLQVEPSKLLGEKRRKRDERSNDEENIMMKGE